MGYGFRCITTFLPDSYSSVLTKTEEYVEGLEDRAVLRLKRNLDKRTKYKSLYDQILCSAYPDMKDHCREYYRGKGPDITEQLSELQIKMIDRSLRIWVKSLIN